ncbi:DUF4276 family protein [Xylophilus sp. GW821-FHT01B05]
MKAIEVVVFAEGQSDEAFLKRVVAPALRDAHIFLKPQTLHTSRDSTGGAINFDRLCRNVRNTLRQTDTSYLTTFFDLYGLDNGMPGYSAALALAEPGGKVRHIERALHEALVHELGVRADRLILHIQPYELEGLFFSNPDALSESVPGWARSANSLQEVRRAFPSPEHINNGFATKPSARLASLLKPAYRKTTHAPVIGQRVGLTAISQECAHFAAWIDRLRQLEPL